MTLKCISAGWKVFCRDVSLGLIPTGGFYRATSTTVSALQAFVFADAPALFRSASLGASVLAAAEL